MHAVVFAYHDVGVNCLNALLYAGIQIDLVVTHQDDPNENVWFGSVAKLCEEQKIWKQMLQSRTLAQIFAILEHFARVPQDFWVRIADGSFKLVSFSIRWGMWQCDAEGTDL